MIEHLLITYSHFSVGIQLVDTIVGIILNRLKKNPTIDDLFNIIKLNFNKMKNGKTEGKGIVQLPKKSEYWKSGS